MCLDIKPYDILSAYIASGSNLAGDLDSVLETTLCQGIRRPFSVGVDVLLNL